MASATPSPEVVNLPKETILEYFYPNLNKFTSLRLEVPMPTLAAAAEIDYPSNARGRGFKAGTNTSLDLHGGCKPLAAGQRKQHFRRRPRREQPEPARASGYMWGVLASLLQEGTTQAECRATDLLDKLEKRQPLQEDSLQHKAATLALETFQGGDVRVAVNACLDVQAMARLGHRKRTISILTAKITSWRANLVPWLIDKRPRNKAA
jgi:hypothetical protein